MNTDMNTEMTIKVISSRQVQVQFLNPLKINGIEYYTWGNKERLGPNVDLYADNDRHFKVKVRYSPSYKEDHFSIGMERDSKDGKSWSSVPPTRAAYEKVAAIAEKFVQDNLESILEQGNVLDTRDFQGEVNGLTEQIEKLAQEINLLHAQRKNLLNMWDARNKSLEMEKMPEFPHSFYGSSFVNMR